MAARQLEGRLSIAIRSIRADLIALLAEIEAAIDFPDDVEPPAAAEIEARVLAALTRTEGLLASADAGRLYREGAAVVIAGRPNAGKSSLLNALLRESRAIVTEIPGTTRDVIEEAVNIRGIPLRAIDTAGLRVTNDVVERIGVERSYREIDAADLVLWVVDLSEPLSEEDGWIGDRLRARPFLIVANKADLTPRLILSDLAGPEVPIIRTVAPTGQGIEALEEAIAQRLLGEGVASEDVLVSNTRHRARLEAASAALREAIRSIAAGFEQAMVAFDLKIAAEALGEITGETVTEATITEIFARFCVGK